MVPKEIYLIFYNLSCCAGWLLILASAAQSLAKDVPTDGLKEALANAYSNGAITTQLLSFIPPLGDLLFFTQSAALLEIVHSAVGLVRSPVVVTAMQVMSRIVALVAVTYSSEAQSE
jgi:very-long-chain (3R)-3-hydroxyacyl-CoA dehydratase